MSSEYEREPLNVAFCFPTAKDLPGIIPDRFLYLPGCPINEQEASQSVKEQREPHYFDDMYPHAIRHTFCSRCFEAGMQPKVVQSIMGHQHYSTIIDIYTHVSESKYREGVRKFGKALEQEETGNEEVEKELHFDIGQTFG